MKYWSAAVLVVALVVALAAAPAASAQTKWVRGTVASVGPDSVTVTVTGTSMTFKVTEKTELTARGAGTAQRQAEAAGAKGVKFTDFVKPGEGIEVHYTEAAGVMTATDIHSGIAASEGAMGPSAPDRGSARGFLTAVTGTSLAIKSGDQIWTFAVDPKTVVQGHGFGTLNRKMAAESKALTVPDLLGVGDLVVVYFREAGGTKLANTVRVVKKAAK